VGFLLDRPKPMDLLHRLWARRVQLLQAIWGYTGPGFNPHSSSPNAKDYLYKKEGLPVIKKTKTGEPSTDEDTLIRLGHPVCSLILAWRKADKLIGTYLANLLRGDTVHTQYNLTGTETGRLSSSDENVANQPAIIKQLMQARPGYVLIEADYEQIELRYAAAESKDPQMVKDLTEGVSIHARLAGAVYGLPPEKSKIPQELYTKAKSGVFEKLYGGGDQTLAQTLGVSVAKARVFAEVFPGWEKHAANVAREARRNGWVATWSGRRRYLWDLHSTLEYLQVKAGREAINTPIQGGVADSVNLGINVVDPWLHELGGRVAHQDHDAIVAEVPEGRVEEAKQALREAMLRAVPDHYKEVLPFEVGFSVGTHWG
jgi:DNA polymerase I